MFLCGFMSLYKNLRPRLNQIQNHIEDKLTLVLDQNLNKDDLAALLYDGGYINDRKDAGVISDWITRQIRQYGKLPNLGALNQSYMKMPALTALSEGGSGLRHRVESDLYNLGIDSDWQQATDDGLKSEFGNPFDPGLIRISIGNASVSDTTKINNIPVRIKEYVYETNITSSSKESAIKETCLVEKTIGYCKTDSCGKAIVHLPKGRSYSVVPINRGFQYGREQGTSNGTLDAPLDLHFTQRQHTIAPFDPYTYRMLKNDKALIVRTPSEFTDSLFFATAIYIFGWLALMVFCFHRDNRLHTRSDYLLLNILMAISGIGLLGIFGMMDPLTDKANGAIMANALLISLFTIGIVSSINFAKLYGRKWFDPVSSIVRKFYKKNNSLDKRNFLSALSGISYLIVAIILIIALAVFGHGPDGSAAKVNLGPIQPSEICKYLIVIFISAFFAENAGLIQAFSQKLTSLTARRQLGTIITIILIMTSLMVLYLKVLSDMGPALVILVTFVLIYSIARRDFAQLLLGLFSFLLAMATAWMINGSTAMLIGTALLWLAAWTAYSWIKSRQIYESAIFLNFIIVAFILGGNILNAIGAKNEATRLSNRTDMAWSGVWDNNIEGGDQVAQGLWSVASGGIDGNGLGNGSPSVVPACHTDMAFNSIGEMTGLIGLTLIVLCFIILIHRSLLISRRAGHPFAFYLSIGIAVVTGVQFIFIVMGSLGLIPLTGVTVPFLSFGRSSLVATFAAFAIVLSISRLKATDAQKAHNNSYNGAIAAGTGLFIIAGAVIICTLVKYQIFSRAETMLHPAYITNTEGRRIIEYNPRISMVLDSLVSGNIYDRNGLLIATSSKDDFKNALEDLQRAGLDAKPMLSQIKKHQRRYYPFGNHLLFMTGDINTMKVFGYYDSNPIGYLTEARHRALLRGIDIPSWKKELTSTSYRENRFMPKSEKSFRLTEYDYSELTRFLNDGIRDNLAIKLHNAARSSRDIYLTIDAALQTKLQNRMAQTIESDQSLKNKKRLRASVVVLDASNGDLLCSANYPLPDQDSIFMLNQRHLYGDAPFEKIEGHQPVTERDLGLTFQTQPGSTAKVMSAIAGFMGLREDASKQRYSIAGEETIEGTKNGSYIEPHGNLSMETAIVKSSNCYFINLIHDKDLYTQLDSLYQTVGIRIHHNITGESETPYFFNRSESGDLVRFSAILSDIGSLGTAKYTSYINSDRKRGIYKKMNWWETAAPWGQGAVRATPLNMARVVSIVANGGQLPPTRYIRQIGDKPVEQADPIPVISASSASQLALYMQKESDKHRANGRPLPGNTSVQDRMGGKTGTPERGDRLGHKPNDAWYIFFINSETLNAPLAVAVRLERTEGLNSAKAVDFAARTIIPTLNEAGYKLK